MPSHRLIPGRRFWGAMIVLLALASLAEMGAFHDVLTSVWNGRWPEQAGWLLGSAVMVLALLASLTIGLSVPSGLSPSTDRVFLVMVLSWFLSALGHGWHQLAPENLWGHWSMLASYQLTATTAALFILACAPMEAPRIRALCWVHLLIAQLLLLAGLDSVGYHDDLLQAWSALNVVFSTVFLLCMGQRLLSSGEPHVWPVLGASLTGWGVALSDLVPNTTTDIQAAPAHYVLATYLLMLWLLVTQRVGRLSSGTLVSHEPSEHSLLGGAFANTHLGWGASDVAGQEEADRQVLQSRRRIAQDLHDGVGSQIVSIISSLDTRVPQQRDMASALEHCLLDVKILVDDIDETHESVLEALGRLRYRVQHSLDRLCIVLHWEVETDGPLQRMNDDRSRQVLRVAQEALANAMRYSHAGHVSVRCAAERLGTVLVLEVQDDGSGFEVPEPGQCGGRGLAGMRRRAESIHGELSLLSEPGCGTLVRLRVPL